MTFREVKERLAKAGAVSPESEAFFLAEAASGWSRSRLLLEPDAVFSPEAETAVCAMLRRRFAGEPVQYITGSAPFRDLELAVNPNVLIPRPETEILAELALEFLPKGGTLLDIGTGSGAIALSIAQERPDARVTALDVSSDALEVARKNARRLGLTERVEFLVSDLFSALPEERGFDVVAANLPYVTPEEYPGLPPEVRGYEPRLALVAPDCGMEIIIRCLRGLPPHLSPGGRAVFEMSPPQLPRFREAAAECGFDTETRRDLIGRERFGIVWKK